LIKLFNGFNLLNEQIIMNNIATYLYKKNISERRKRMNIISKVIKRIGLSFSLSAFFVSTVLLISYLIIEFYKTIKEWIITIITLKEEISLHIIVISLVILFTIGLILYLLGEILEFFFGNYDSVLLEPREYSLTEKEKSKISVIIPAYNEEKTIKKAIESVIPYCNNVIVVNDGSNDNTEKIALNSGALLLTHKLNKGLGQSLRDGIKKAISIGSEIIVNFDADLQYRGEDIPKLVYFILYKDYDLMMGSRFSGTIEKMHWMKKLGNKMYTKLIKYITKTGISDAQTGFRAFTAEFAKNIKIRGNFTYTQEMIIEACSKKMKIGEIPIFFAKREDGKSRLMKNPFDFAKRSGILLLTVLIDLYPLKIYSIFSGVLFIIGFYVGGKEIIDLILYQQIFNPYLLIISVTIICFSIALLATSLLINSTRRE